MSGGGGGSSGQVSYPEYLQTFHSVVLDQNNSDAVGFSIADAMNAAHGNSPFTGVTVVDPASYLATIASKESIFEASVTGFDNIVDYQAAHAAAMALYVLDTAPLESATADVAQPLPNPILSTTTADTAPTKDTVSAATAPTKDVVATTTAPTKDAAPTKDVATLDTAPTKDVAPVAIQYTAEPVTPDSIVVDESAIAADVATYADQLRADIENNVLPRYKAGMLNVNAITSSAFVIGEALIWAEYDRNVARYAAELRSKIVLGNDGYNVQLKIAASTQYNERVTQAQRLTAQENLAVREENKDYSLAFREENRSYKLVAKEETRAYNLSYREENRTYTLAHRDENKSYKLAEKEETRAYNLAFREENRAYKLTEKEEARAYNLAFRDENRTYKLAASEQTSRFKLANTSEQKDLTIGIWQQEEKYKLAASEQNMRFKLQKNELDASHKLNRQKNILLAVAEIMRLLTAKVEFDKAVVDSSAKVSAMQITARNEQIHEQTVIDEDDAKWDLELFQYAANMIAAVSGGTSQNVKKQSKAVSALGGALSGAAMGAAIGAPTGIGAPIGAAAGAVVGGLAGYLQ